MERNSHPAGGTIRQRPYGSASARIDATYRIGSSNSSGVGWNTGASFTAAMRYFGAISRALRDQRPRARTECAEEGEKKREGGGKKTVVRADDEKAHTGIPRINNNVD